MLFSIFLCDLGKNESLRKRPRLQSSEVIKINPRPNVIRTGRLNGRLRFAPLFEKRRKENFEKFAKALDMTSQSKSKKKSKQRINQLTRFTLPFMMVTPADSAYQANTELTECLALRGYITLVETNKVTSQEDLVRSWIGRARRST